MFRIFIYNIDILTKFKFFTIMIYLIDFETCYKIGRTSNLKSRLRNFKNSRESVKCLNIININHNLIDAASFEEKLEKELHKRCKTYHIVNELFQKVDEVLDIFSEYKKELGDLKDYTEELYKITEDLINKEHNKVNKETFQYDLNGNFIKHYLSRRQAEQENNIYKGKITDVISGRNLTSGGFLWSDHLLSEEEIKEKLNKINKSKFSKLNKNTKLIQLDIENNVIKKWDSMTQASKELGIPISSISLCCKGVYKTAGKFKWEIN